MKTHVPFILLGLVAALPATASTIIPAVAPSHPIALRHATVVTVSGGTLANADVVLSGGRITAVGPGAAIPADAQIIDVSGRWIYPGLIDANTEIGLKEIESIRATVDTTEVGTTNPDVRAQVAINPDTEELPVARANGVLTALVVPLAHPVAGLSALIRLDGWTWEDLTIRPAVALHVYWPSMALNRDPRAPKTLVAQQKEIDEALRKLDDTFALARAYAQARNAGTPVDTDTRWEAMRPVFTGERPVFVHADALKEISAALAWARKQHLKITLVGGADAWRVTDELRADGVPVIVTVAHDLPLRRDEDYDANFALAEKLRAAGVRFCVASPTEGEGDTLGNERNLPYLAAQAVAYGLPADEALKAVTLYPAQLLGVGAELGSIEVGKRATLIVTDGDPLQIPTHVLQAFVDGAPIELRNRQTALYEKYRERIRRMTPPKPKS